MKKKLGEKKNPRKCFFGREIKNIREKRSEKKLLNHKRETLNPVVHRLQDALQMSPVCVCVGMNRFSPPVRDRAAQKDEFQLLVSTEWIFLYFLTSLLSVTLQLLRSEGEQGVNLVTTCGHLERHVSL